MTDQDRRLMLEIRHNESKLKLRESEFGSIIPPYQQLMDGLSPIFPVYPTRTFFNDAQLRLIRLYANWLYWTNPTAQGIIRGKKNFVFGTGFSYTIMAKAGERVAKPLIEQSQRILDDFMEANEWDIREPEAYVRSHRDGENILRIFPDDDDDLCCANLRSVEPEQIVPFDGTPEWACGVHREVDDREKVLGYCVTYNGATGEEVEPEFMSFTKINVDLAMPRGLTSLFTSQELLIGTRNLMKAGVEGESVRQAIAYIIEHALAPMAGAQALADLNLTTPSPVFGGNSVPTEHILPGSVPEVNAGQLFKPPPVSDTSNATGMLTAAFQTLSVFWQVPEWMCSGSTGQTNFAASLTAESPLVKDVHSEQKFFSNQNIRLFTKVLRVAESQGRLPEGTVSKLKIWAECPSPAVRDAAKETDTNKILSDAGLLSDKTWSEREELDREQEIANGAKKAVNPGAPNAPDSDTPGAQYQREVNK